MTVVLNDVRIVRALESILQQRDCGELELIVIDGGSTDGTLDVLEGFRSRVHVLLNERDEGIFDAMNKGIARASGDVVGVLNADDRYHDDLVLHDITAAFQDPEVDACYGDLLYIDHLGQLIRYWRSGSFHPWKMYLGWMPPHPTFFLRRRVYEEFGCFDLDFPIAADYELVLRLLLRHRIRPTYVNRVLVDMATGGNSNGSMSKILKGNIEVFHAWRRNRLSFGYMAPLLKPAGKLVQFVRAPRATQSVSWARRSHALGDRRRGV